MRNWSLAKGIFDSLIFINRLQEKLDEQIKSKEQCLKSSMQLKHHIQNIVVQKMENAETVHSYRFYDHRHSKRRVKVSFR